MNNYRMSITSSQLDIPKAKSTKPTKPKASQTFNGKLKALNKVLTICKQLTQMAIDQAPENNKYDNLYQSLKTNSIRAGINNYTNLEVPKFYLESGYENSSFSFEASQDFISALKVIEHNAYNTKSDLFCMSNKFTQHNQQVFKHNQKNIKQAIQLLKNCSFLPDSYLENDLQQLKSDAKHGGGIDANTDYISNNEK